MTGDIYFGRRWGGIHGERGIASTCITICAAGYADLRLGRDTVQHGIVVPF